MFFFNHNCMKKSPSKLSENETVCICKDDLCEGLGQKGCYLCEGGGNHLKYLRRLWIEKKGENFKKGVASWVKGQAPERRGPGTPLQTMVSILVLVCTHRIQKSIYFP